jgi:hypothetical protein
VNLREGTVVEDWLPLELTRRIEKGTVIQLGSHLLVQSQTGNLFLLEHQGEEAKLAWRYDSLLSGSQCWACPVVQRGRLYVRDDTTVKCFDLTPPIAPTPAP